MNVHSTNMPALEIAERSDPGRDPEKQVNEDSCGQRATRFGHLAVVCDGMGGHVGGKEASALALATMFETFEKAAPDHTPRNVLRGAIEIANERVWALAPPDATARPGSTAVAILVHADGVEVAHVGDSRCYRLHDGKVTQITKDHSLVQGLVDAGLVKPEEAKDHPSANRITRALGTQPEVEVEVAPTALPLVAGDVFLLCSDGLWDLVEPEDILAAVGSQPVAEAAQQLVDLANARGGHDNITAIVVRVPSPASKAVTPAEPPAPIAKIRIEPPIEAQVPKEKPAPARIEPRVVSAADRERRRRQILLVAPAGAVLVVVALVWGLHSRAERAEAALAPAIAPFVGAGFARVPPGIFSASQRVEVDTTEGTCVLAVASPGAGAIHLERPDGSDTAKGSLLHCGCAPEHLAARVDEAPGVPSAVALLRVDARAIGGRYAFMAPAPASIGPGGEACSSEHLEAYVASEQHPKSPPSETWGATPVGTVLSASGFAAIARVPTNQPLVLEPATNQCFVATGGGAMVGLRVMGNVVALAANVAWCAAKVGVVLVERSGVGTIDVAAAPVQRVGGLLGLRDALAAASIEATVWAPATDHAELSAASLRASLVGDVVAAADGSIRKEDSPGARVIALSAGDDKSFEPDSASDVFFLCVPPIAAGTRQNLCVQSGAQTWHPPPPPVPAGAAYGSLPVWMSAWSKSHDPDVVRLQLMLVGLARRLKARGYEPTIIEGVKEEDEGVSIAARSGEDSVVAVGLWPTEPWVDPYGDPPWTLDGEPRIVALTGGERVRLRAHVQSTAPVGARRTVVFRHTTTH
jgi:protein phosphatase